MNLKQLATHHASFNLWANEQFVTWLSKKSEEQLRKEVPSSFSSILKTLNHIWGMEEYWHAVIFQKPDFIHRNGVENLHADDVFQGLLRCSKAWTDDASLFSDNGLSDKIKVVTPWFEANQTRYQYIQHLFNHSTYHRGQVVTIARNLGITDAPMTDLLFYNIAREKSIAAM
ncbi:MAG TPA: DinB family protein [Flavipsychrobacter sp.]|nr:DinB family protein [Flavipsychrobacter sp.]